MIRNELDIGIPEGVTPEEEELARGLVYARCVDAEQIIQMLGLEE